MKTAPRKFELTADILLRAYSIGVFPMAESRDAKDLFWVEPQERAVAYVRPDEMHQAFNFDFLTSSWIAEDLRAVIT